MSNCPFCNAELEHVRYTEDVNGYFHPVEEHSKCPHGHYWDGYVYGGHYCHIDYDGERHDFGYAWHDAETAKLVQSVIDNLKRRCGL